MFSIKYMLLSSLNKYILASILYDSWCQNIDKKLISDIFLVSPFIDTYKNLSSLISNLISTFSFLLFAILNEIVWKYFGTDEEYLSSSV